MKEVNFLNSATSYKKFQFLIASIFSVFVFSNISLASQKIKLSYGNCPSGQQSGHRITEDFYQLTGTHLVPGQTEHIIEELPDPAPPYVNTFGEVEIYGSANYFIRYANWKAFSLGGCYEIVSLDLKNPNYLGYPQRYSQPWDVRKFRIEENHLAAREILVGGAMSASDDHLLPVWPDDNINRRLYFYRPNSLFHWVRDFFPIVNRSFTGWIGHSYGGNLIQEDVEANVLRPSPQKKVAMFFEKVSDDTNNTPFKTEIFGAILEDLNNSLPGSEFPILKIGNSPYPSLKRTVGGYLAEGPRPIQVKIRGQKYFLIGFSSGDFPTNGYTINFLWSRFLMGPYQPLLNADKSDLKDFGADIKTRENLSWVGRPALYVTPTGEYEMLFHGVKKEILPNNDYTKWPTRYDLWNFFRCIFKVKVELDLDQQGEPVIKLLNRQSTN